MQQPIPAPHPDDDEDVSWALSTASALWSRGEVAESLKWLRRAAETASDANRDMRAVELFKAAAEVATLADAARAQSSVAPGPSQIPPSQAPQNPGSQFPPTQPTGEAPQSRRPPGPPPRRSGPPPQGIAPVAAPTPRTPPGLPNQPVATPRPSGPPPNARPSGPPPLVPPARPSAVPPTARSAPPPPRSSTAGAKPLQEPRPAPPQPVEKSVALRKGGPAAVAAARGTRRDTATGQKGRGGANPAAKVTIKQTPSLAQELTSDRATFTGLGAVDVSTGDDATTSPHVDRGFSRPTESAKSAAEPSRSSAHQKPRDEEITVQRTFFPNEPAGYESAHLKPGFDLDEKTSVASESPAETGDAPEAAPRDESVGDSQRPPSSERTLTGMPVPAAREPGGSFRPPPSAGPLMAPASSPSQRGGIPRAPLSPRFDTERPNPRAEVRNDRNFDAEDSDLRQTVEARFTQPTEGITSFKVAVVADESGGVELVLLRPGEPAAEGLVTAYVVPTDHASSQAIALLLRRRSKS